MLPARLVEECMKEIRADRCEGFVEGEGPADARLMWIGEAPGADEVAKGVPFSGKAGRELTGFIQSIGLQREDVYITSVVRTRPFKVRQRTGGRETPSKANRPPTQREVRAHAPLLDYQIDRIRPEVIVTLGNTALKRLLGKDAAVSDIHGSWIHGPILRSDGSPRGPYVKSERSYVVFPTYHPASVFYNPSLRETIRADLNRLSDVLKQKGLL